MKITRGLFVSRVAADNNCEITLVENWKESVVTLDPATMRRYGLPLSLDLLRHKIICTFESQVSADVDADAFGDFVLMGLEKRETREVIRTVPPVVKTVLSRCLSLNSEDVREMEEIPYPQYHFKLELTEEEYAECKELPPETFFRVSMKLA